MKFSDKGTWGWRIDWVTTMKHDLLTIRRGAASEPAQTSRLQS